MEAIDGNNNVGDLELKGRLEGIEVGILEVAIKMIERNMDLNLISELTGYLQSPSGKAGARCQKRHTDATALIMLNKTHVCKIPR